ncbi:uncharacterized protein IL334_006627 [Kwoniella shivajii]|uniref:N-acetyltransferase domain-containing protein n=1 Tax=Kwoniella shivajii TaxID=564305 RepID=A0ABZ1D6H0_9TREE|nr:hypothetical protein IL334_006627 [Kwoniella shivajii]
MQRPVANIQGDHVRPLESSDEKIVKMLIGQGVMEGIAQANNKFITHPGIIILILVLGHLLNQVMSFKADSSNPLSYFTPLIGPCLITLPFLGIAEYIHRPRFTALLRKVIGGEDLIRLYQYYSTSSFDRKGNSGWVFIHKEEIVGVILIDQSNPGKSLDSVLGEEEGQIKYQSISNTKTETTTMNNKSILDNHRNVRRRNIDTNKSVPIASVDSDPTRKNMIQIRHLEVDSPYRQSGISLDLLLAALDQAFTSKDIEQVIIQTKPFSDDKYLNQVGFERLSNVEIDQSDLEEPVKIGLLGWKGHWLSLDRMKWDQNRKSILDRVAKGRKVN